MNTPLALLLSALAAIFWTAAAAHEVQPAMGNFSVGGGTLRLEVAVNGEAIVAGADLEGLIDTDASGVSQEVDALRQLPPDELEQQIRGMAEEIAGRIVIEAGGAAVPLTLRAVEVAPVGDTARPRQTVLTFTGELPDRARRMRVTWPATFGLLVLRERDGADPLIVYLEGGLRSEPIPLDGGTGETGWRAVLSYLPLGFAHIVPKGLDHILFVLGLFFLAPRIGPLLWQVSAFTLAHTVTLGLGALGVVTLPAGIVEPIIAASIVYVGVENVVTRGLSPWRPAVVFLFGLLHGLGFAAVLSEIGLPPGGLAAALLGFNLGVELGQLAVIAAVFVLVWTALRVDDGAVSSEAGQTFYALLTGALVVLSFVLDGPGFTKAAGVAAPVILLPLAALSALCILAARNVDRLDAYLVYVAVPASSAIALAGAWCVVERVFP